MWRPNLVRLRTNVQNTNSAADDQRRRTGGRGPGCTTSTTTASATRERADPQRDDQRRVGRQPGRLARAQARELHRRVEPRSDDHAGSTPSRRGRKSFARPMTKSFWRITVPLRADQQQHDAVPREQAGQRDDERRDADLRDDQPVERPDRRGRRRATIDDREPGRQHVAVAGSAGSRSSTPPTPQTKPTERSISPSSSDERRCPCRSSRSGAIWTIRLTKLPAVRKLVVLGLEDDRDDDQADDDRQRAELAAADVGPPALRVRADGVWRAGVAAASAAAAEVRSAALMRPPPRAGRAPSESLPAVIASTTSCWFVSRALELGDVLAEAQHRDRSRRPRRCRAGCARSARPPRPCSPRRATRSSTCRVCATPSAAVGSSRITTLASSTSRPWRPRPTGAGRPRAPATVWRTERIVVTERPLSVSRRPLLHRRLVEAPQRRELLAARGTCSGRRRGCRPARGPGRRPRCPRPAASFGPWMFTGLPSKRISPLVDRVDAGDALDQRRLAGAVVADERHDLAGARRGSRPRRAPERRRSASRPRAARGSGRQLSPSSVGATAGAPSGAPGSSVVYRPASVHVSRSLPAQISSFFRKPLADVRP